MAVLKWDEIGQHYYENGVDHGVLFVADENGSFYTGSSTTKKGVKGVAWNGLTNVTLSPEGAEPNDIYADNIKYLSLMSVETLNATIEAYQSPAEFDVCDGTVEIASNAGITIGQQERRKFAFAFRTNMGSDANAKLGHTIHVIYGCLASPAERAYETINDSPDAMTLSWDVSTTPVNVTVGTDEKTTSLVTIHEYVNGVKNANYAKIEAMLIGDASNDSQYMSPDDIIAAL